MTDLWSEASRDYEAEGHAYRMEMAKSASAQLWPFLAVAQSQAEFKDRVALASQSIQRVASENGVRAQDLLRVFADRFALLMEAKGNPFDKDDDGDSDSDDQDDSDESGDHGKDDYESDHGDDDSDQDDSDDDEDDEDSDKDDSHVDDAGTDDSDDNGADGDDDEEQDDDGDDNADDDESGHDKDDDQKDDMDGREAAPFGGLYSHLLAKINSGEDVSTWGRRPFAGSPRTAGFGDPGGDQVTDENVPTPPPPSADAGGVDAGGLGVGMPPAEALTTKPRQQPGGDQQLSEPPGGSAFDPAMNGGDIDAGEDSEVTAKLKAITREVMDFNPNLTERQARKVARQVVARYLKTAEDLSPLLYGDRGDSAPDGPLTDAVKNWSPPDINRGGGGDSPSGPSQPELPPGESQSEVEPGTDGGGGGAADAAAGAAEGGEAAGGAAELLPLLAL